MLVTGAITLAQVSSVPYNFFTQYVLVLPVAAQVGFLVSTSTRDLFRDTTKKIEREKSGELLTARHVALPTKPLSSVTFLCHQNESQVAILLLLALATSSSI